MYEVFFRLIEERGISIRKMCADLGISPSSITDWKKGRSVPKLDKMQRIADYFGVTVEYLMTGEKNDGYYLNPETAKAAQEVFDDPNLRALFHAARGSSPENIQIAADLLTKLKATNPDG